MLSKLAARRGGFLSFPEGKTACVRAAAGWVAKREIKKFLAAEHSFIMTACGHSVKNNRRRLRLFS